MDHNERMSLQRAWFNFEWSIAEQDYVMALALLRDVIHDHPDVGAEWLDSLSDHLKHKLGLGNYVNY